MRNRIAVKFGALALLASVGVIIVPGCVVRIGPGTGEPTGGDSTGVGGGGGAGSGSGDLGSGGQTPEEQGAAALAQVTPQALALDEARTWFAAYDTMGLVATSVSDPSTLDEETLMQLIV